MMLCCSCVTVGLTCHVFLHNLCQEPEAVFLFTDVLHDVGTDVIHTLTVAHCVVSHAIGEEYPAQHLKKGGDTGAKL